MSNKYRVEFEKSPENFPNYKILPKGFSPKKKRNGRRAKEERQKRALERLNLSGKGW